MTAEEEGLADIFEKLVEDSIEDLKKQVSSVIAITRIPSHTKKAWHGHTKQAAGMATA